MSMETDTVIGIVGGMGPQAGLTLCNSILHHTQATADQQHLSFVLMSYPKHIVDRTAFLEGKISVNPAFTIAGVIRKLEGIGAQVVGIACNTSHAPAIYDVVLEELKRTGSNVKLLNMPLETCRYIRRFHPAVSRIGLMTTNGTYKSGVYKKMLEAHGYEVVLPDLPFQHEVIHKMIYDPVIGVKSNTVRVTREVELLMEESVNFFKRRKAQAIILGCTELSLLVSTTNKVEGIAIIDSTEALAKALINEAVSYTASDVISPSSLIRESMI